MYRSGLVDTLVTHANTNGVWPNFLVWSPLWLYASSVKNKTSYLIITTVLFQPQWKWMREFFFSQVFGKECDLNKAIMRKSHTNEALMERNLMSKLLYYSLVSYEETGTDTENYENNPLVPTESHSHVKGVLISKRILIS